MLLRAFVACLLLSPLSAQAADDTGGHVKRRRPRRRVLPARDRQARARDGGPRFGPDRSESSRRTTSTTAGHARPRSAAGADAAQAVVTGTVEHPEFTVEKLHFQSRPGLYVTGNLYLPKDLDKAAADDPLRLRPRPA